MADNITNMTPTELANYYIVQQNNCDYLLDRLLVKCCYADIDEIYQIIELGVIEPLDIFKYCSYNTQACFALYNDYPEERDLFVTEVCDLLYDCGDMSFYQYMFKHCDDFAERMARLNDDLLPEEVCVLFNHLGSKFTKYVPNYYVF